MNEWSAWLQKTSMAVIKIKEKKKVLKQNEWEYIMGQ